MIDKQSILLRYFRQGQSQRQISKALGISRPTVRKYIESHEQSLQSKQADETLDSTGIIAAPRYDSSRRIKRKLTIELAGRIDAYLEKNKQRRSSGMSKQILKKIDIWEAVRAEGFDISYPTVCNYIRTKETSKEAFIRQTYTPGSVCEFDWGEVKLTIKGVTKVYYLAVFTLAWSNYRFAVLFERQNSQCFQQSHVVFFEHLGGVPAQMVYDNMRVAVKRFVGPQEREATQDLLSMSMYYQFDFRFCNIGKGNEKGHVERSVEYIRRKSFAVRTDFEDLPSANEYLFNRLDILNKKPQKTKGASAMELLKESSPYLGFLPTVAMECASWESLRVDKYSTICLMTNHYSVPEHLVSKMVDVKVYADKIKIYHEGKALWTHQRHYTAFQWYLHLEHYLKTLERKPGALKGATALEQAQPLVKQTYEQYFYDNPRQFIDLLHYQRQKQLSWTKIQQTIDQLLTLGCRHISLDKIKVCLENAPKANPIPLNGQIEQLATAQLKTVADLFHLN